MTIKQTSKHSACVTSEKRSTGTENSFVGNNTEIAETILESNADYTDDVIINDDFGKTVIPTRFM